MGGCAEQDVMGLESRAVSARVVEHIVTIFSKTCATVHYMGFQPYKGLLPTSCSIQGMSGD